MLRSCCIGVALVAMLNVACNDREAERSRSAPSEGAAAPSAEPPQTPRGAPSRSPNAIAETRMSEEEQALIQKLARSNQLELELARMAQDKAQNQQVKELAEELEDDHTQALDELRRLANRASAPIEDPNDAARVSLNQKLRTASGRQFDRQFLAEVVENHRQEIAEFEKMRSTATGEAMAFIDKSLPVMRRHLESTEALQKELQKSPR
jgi:putative membrane protein